MAAVEVEAARKAEDTWTVNSNSSGKQQQQGVGLWQYYLQRIHELQLMVRQKTHNLNRLNSRVRMLREVLQLLEEPGSYVGKLMDKNKVDPEGKYVVFFRGKWKYVIDIGKSLVIRKITQKDYKK